MAQAEYQETAELLRNFFAGCERGLKFLETEYGFHSYYGLCEYHKGYKIIRPIDDARTSNIEDSFIAVMRYEREDQSFEIEYGHDRHAVQTHLFYDPIERFGVSEILLAARKMDEELPDIMDIRDTESLENALTTLTQIFSSHSRILVEPGEKVLSRARTIRSSRLEQSIRRKFEEDMNDASQSAAKAYMQKNYSRVVELLEPFKTYLGKGDLKKLDRAKKFIIQK